MQLVVERLSAPLYAAQVAQGQRDIPARRELDKKTVQSGVSLLARSADAKLNNPALLTWARESVGYSAQDVADFMDKPVDTILSWERGDDAPTYKQLKRFAAKVGRAVATLYLPLPPDDTRPPKDFRVMPDRGEGSFTPKAHIAFRELEASVSQLRLITTSLRQDIRLQLPRWGRPADATTRAAELREHVGISLESQLSWRNWHQALNEWEWALLSRGVLTQVFQMPIDDVRAFSLIADGLGGVGLNSSELAPGRVFSLFHEVAHLCLRQPGVSGEYGSLAELERSASAQLERYCNRVAAEFLLPPKHPEVLAAVEELSHSFTREVADRLARRFCVSKYVIARRTLEVGGVDASLYWSTRDRWEDEDERARTERGSGDGGPNWVTMQVSHHSKPFVLKVFDAVDIGALSAHDASEILSVSPSRLEEARAKALR